MGGRNENGGGVGEDDDVEDLEDLMQKNTRLVKSSAGGGEDGFWMGSSSSRKSRQVGKTDLMVRTIREAEGRRRFPA